MTGNLIRVSVEVWIDPAANNYNNTGYAATDDPIWDAQHFVEACLDQGAITKTEVKKARWARKPTKN